MFDGNEAQEFLQKLLYLLCGLALLFGNSMHGTYSWRTFSANSFWPKDPAVDLQAHNQHNHNSVAVSVSSCSWPGDGVRLFCFFGSGHRRLKKFYAKSFWGPGLQRGRDVRLCITFSTWKSVTCPNKSGRRVAANGFALQWNWKRDLQKLSNWADSASLVTQVWRNLFCASCVPQQSEGPHS